jgi:hypothetical protein
MVVPRGTRLPPTRCLFCGGREYIRAWNVEFMWTPGRVQALILVIICMLIIAPLLPLLAGLGLISAPWISWAFLSKARLTLPRCEPCRERQETAVFGGVMGGCGVLAGLPVAFGLLGGVTMGVSEMVQGAVGGAVAGLVLMLLIQGVWMRRRIVRCRRIDDATVELRVPDPNLTREALAGMSGPM